MVAFRVLLSLAFCGLALTVMRGWRRLAAIFRTPRVLLLVGLGGAFIFANWELYVIAVDAGAVVDAALGYFITPILTVLLGVVVLRERLRAAQWVAVGISVVAILVIAIGGATFPWIALGLAASFSLYGLVKKWVGPRIGALEGLTLETGWLAPVAAVQLGVVAATSGLTIGHHGAGQTIWLLLAGVVTAVPLLMFASAARRLPLVAVGLAQYVTPVLQFLIGVVVLHEVMPLGRWMGFALVWAAILVLTADLVVAARRRGPADPVASTGRP